MLRKGILVIALILLGAVILSACAGPSGAEGPPGPQGPAGLQGPAGPAGPGLTEEQTAALETAGSLAGIQFPELDEARRGCPACHVLVEDDGRYTLPFEAHERAEARGEEHPDTAPDGTSLAPTEEVNVRTCLQCHASGSSERAGKGVVAPLSLRDIVHPAHMYSQWFKLHYGGNCFTCHNVSGEGEFELLTEKVEVNEKGVPDPENLPIPGAIRIGQAQLTMGSTSEGGRLYDNWWQEAGVDEPSADQPLWATQTTNTRSGGDTWRCKECHGWDYKGAEGAYGSGSHFTGFPGVLDAQSKSGDDLVAVLTGGVIADHDFSAMGEDAITSLVSFLKEGLVDVTPLIDAETKAAIGGDVAHGGELYSATCASCHGEDGKALNFGSADEPEYVSTIALDNPWEFIHKVRAGQPGTGMPAAIDADWSLQDVLDLLAFAQTLSE